MDPQKNDLTEQEELKILGEILEAYIDTPIEKDAFLICDLGLDSFLIVYFISEVDDRFGVTIEMPEHVVFLKVFPGKLFPSAQAVTYTPLSVPPVPRFVSPDRDTK